jgi:hypothetical protein
MLVALDNAVKVESVPLNFNFSARIFSIGRPERPSYLANAWVDRQLPPFLPPTL